MQMQNVGNIVFGLNTILIYLILDFILWFFCLLLSWQTLYTFQQSFELDTRLQAIN